MYETGVITINFIEIDKTHHNSDDIFYTTKTETIILSILIIDLVWVDLLLNFFS